MRISNLIGGLYILSCCASAMAQQSPSKPTELDVLGHYVGDWSSEVTGKPAAWTPNEIAYRTSSHAEFLLNGWFLQRIEVSHIVGDPDKVTKSLFFWTYDSSAQKYVSWLFQSSGVIGKWIGTWNSEDQSLTATSPLAPPNTAGLFTETFANDDTIRGSLVFTGNGGGTLFDMQWTRTRQKNLVPNPMREVWLKIDEPIQTIPEETKELQAFIGKWDTEFVQRPSAASPAGNTSTGVMTGDWILDGRFLFGRSEVGSYKSIWVAGYDTNRQEYRYIRMSNTGQLDESVGQWNDDLGGFVWKVVNEKPGITRTSTSRFLGDDAVQTHILSQDGNGKVQMDLKIRATRQK